MRILILNWRDITHPWAGGAELNIHEQAKRWVQLGHEVTIFCGAYRGSRRTEIVDGIRVVRRGGRFSVYLWAPAYYLLRFRGRYDVIIDVENGIPFFTPLYAGIPKVCLFHHVHTEQFLYEFPPPVSWAGVLLESKVMPFVYRTVPFVTISQSSRRALGGMGIDPEQCAVVHPGLDGQCPRSLVSKARHPMLVYLGRLMAYKRVDWLIKMMVPLVEAVPDATLHIVGRGPVEGELKRMAAEHCLEDHVVFHGHVSEEEKYALLSRAWVLVTASIKEGWGLVVIEANACGTPAIAYNVAGLCETIQDGRTGLLAANEQEYLEHTLRILRDRKLRSELSVSAVQYARHYSWDSAASQSLDVLRRAATGNFHSCEDVDTGVRKTS